MKGFHNAFRKDRRDRLGGGVAIYIKSNLAACQLNDLDVPGLEGVWVTERRKNLVGAMYRPSGTGVGYWDLIDQSFEQAKQKGFEDILIMGDLNEDQLRKETDYKRCAKIITSPR